VTLLRYRDPTTEEPLAVLLLPSKLEDFAFAEHARDLLDVPRVVALEPPRRRIGPAVGEFVAMRQARRLRFPGDPRVLVLYHPLQYPLARALGSFHPRAELWYVLTGEAELGGEEPDQLRMAEFHRLAGERALKTMSATQQGEPRIENEELRRRLVELEVISARPFVPGGRVERR
jgi:hypothetical protein